MKPKNNRKELHVYLDEKTFKALKTLSELNRRSMNAEVIIAIENRVEVCKKRGQDV